MNKNEARKLRTSSTMAEKEKWRKNKIKNVELKWSLEIERKQRITRN